MAGREMGRVLYNLKAELDKMFGDGNWKLRKVSRARKGTDFPSLTITEELSKIGCNPDDYVVVALVEDKILIYRV